ncbi:MAG: hypothetical protein EOO77_40500 [Oxalobacteraceae bacterium]|nr:MAG: hypothetical protein EOO77_40500 [Oxalobacteraceae bacterium]
MPEPSLTGCFLAWHQELASAVETFDLLKLQRPIVGRSTTFGYFPELDVRSGRMIARCGHRPLAVLLPNILARADQD